MTAKFGIQNPFEHCFTFEKTEQLHSFEKVIKHLKKSSHSFLLEKKDGDWFIYLFLADIFKPNKHYVTNLAKI